MTDYDSGRRHFLIAATVGAGSVATSGVLANEPTAPSNQTVAHHPPPIDGPGVFLNYDELLTVAAFVERLMPGEPGKPGARDAGVANYVDLALAGAYADLQDFYRRGLAELDAYCRRVHANAFLSLNTGAQDGVIAALEQGDVPEFVWPTSRSFFETLRTHTMEGMFADPVYGGNHDFAGWRLVGFPGAQHFFAPTDLESSGAFTRASIVGMRSE